jgi:hypothetical protein
MKTIIVGVFVALLLLLVAIAPADSATRYVEEPFGGVNLLGEAGKDVKSWVPRTVPDHKYKKYKKKTYAKKINEVKRRKKAAKKKSVIKTYIKKQVAKQRAKKKARKEFYDVKPSVVKPRPPSIKSAAIPAIPELAPRNTIEEEPVLEYDAETDETPLVYNDGYGVVRPRQPNFWDKIKEWWSGRKMQRNFSTPKDDLDFLEQRNSTPLWSWGGQKEELEFLKPKPKYDIIAELKEWFNGLTKSVQETVIPEKKVEVAEADKCAPITWEVPTNISSLGLRIINPDGSVSNQMNISSYLSIRPHQKFQLIPRCR